MARKKQELVDSKPDKKKSKKLKKEDKKNKKSSKNKNLIPQKTDKVDKELMVLGLLAGDKKDDKKANKKVDLHVNGEKLKKKNRIESKEIKNIDSSTDKKERKKKIRKKRKKVEIAIDKPITQGIVLPQKRGRKRKNMNEGGFPDHEDFKEGHTKRRKKRVIPDYVNLPYQFKDSFELHNGDAREDFKQVDDGHVRNVWCDRRGFWMFAKLCGLYATPKCKNRIKCQYYEYGMEIKHRYQLLTVELSDKSKKNGGDGLDIGCEDNGNGSSNENYEGESL